jgi:hypothetical protein
LLVPLLLLCAFLLLRQLCPSFLKHWLGSNNAGRPDNSSTNKPKYIDPARLVTLNCSQMEAQHSSELGGN